MQKAWTDGQKNEFRFKSTYCRFKIWFGMKDKNNKTFFGIETNCTPLQIATGRVKEVAFDKKMGYENCLAMEEKNRGKYETAIIYQKKHKIWFELHKYRFGKMVETGPVDLTNPVTVADVVLDENNNWYLKRRLTQPVLLPDEQAAPADQPPAKKPAGHRSEISRADAIASKYLNGRN